MNKALNIIKTAQTQGVKLELENGSLVLRLETEEIDEVLLAEIKQHKELIVEHLKKFDIADAYEQSDKDAIKPFDRAALEKVPLSFSQESLWFVHQLQGSLEYHLPFALKLSGNLNQDALSASLRQVVNRHEILRTVIYSEEGVGYQKLLPAEGWELVTRDLRKDNSTLNQDLKAFLLAPFNLDADYMFRSCLYDLGIDEQGEQEYLLAGVFHHIASDAWSQGILMREFVMLYGAHVSGKPPILPPLPLQYADYAVWQRTNLEENVIDKQLSYWEKQLDGFSELQLPVDHGRQAAQGISGANATFQLNSAVSAGIKSLSQSEGATVFMTLLAAFKVLLSRYSGQEDICVGTSVANRTQKELEGIIGYFVNTLALRTQATQSSSFKEFLQAVKQTTLEAYDHQQVPLEKVVDRVVETRDQSTNPLFKVLFVMQNAPQSTGGIELDGLTLSGYGEKIKETANFDLKMTVHESAAGFFINLNYATDLYKETTIQRMISHYQKLLSEIVRSPLARLGDLSLLDAEETHLLTEGFNHSAVRYAKDQTIVDLFEAKAIETPATTALVFEGDTLSYQQLDERSNQLGHYLVGQGVSPDTLVGICISRSLEMMVAIWGILKAGGAYVPMDPEFPQSRIDYMLEDSGIKVLLSDHQNGPGFSTQQGIEVIELDSDWAEKIGEQSVESLKRLAVPANLAYVIYTSGSTGKPKGVQITHHCLTDYFHGLVDKTNVESCKRFGLSSSIATDLGNTVLYSSLLVGGTLYVLTEDELISAEKMSQLDLDCLKMVPSHWKTLQSKEALFVPNQCLILGGEAFTDDVLELLTSNQVSCEVYNHYGPTETTIGKLIHKVSLTEKPDHSIPLGTPFGNNRVYVLDNSDHLCPIGVVGELCIGGQGVAVGYLNHEALTTEKFIADPFRKGERIYKTGDLARWLPNGTVEFFGRKDNQIKIRGYRIELGEIENVLSSVEYVSNGCVLASEDNNGDKRLVGYVVIEGLDTNVDKDTWKDTLQEELKQSLPEYMVPTLWVALQELPLTSNGKIDRKALPEPDSSGLSGREYVAPRNEAEEQLAAIWQDLLGVEQVGIYDNFFQLGGQSLLAIRLIARIQKLGYTLNIGDFYADPNIALLSTKLDSADSGYQVPENGIKEGCPYITPSMVTLIDLNQEALERVMDSIPGSSANIQDIYPLSPLQEGIYFHHLMSDRNAGDPYLFSNLLSFASAEQRAQFIEGLRFVIGRHDVFRTCMLSDGFAQAIQVVLRQVELPVEQLSIDSNLEILPQVEQQIAPENLYIDLTTAPMMRVKTANDAANGAYYLVLDHHHLMMDHIGMAKVREEIMCYLSGQAAVLPVPSLYRNFIGDTLNKEKLAESKDYFSDLYGRISVPTYPFDLSDTLVDGSTHLVSSKVVLSPELRDDIRKLSEDLQISPAVLFHAAFGLVVGRCSNTDYAIFGSVLLGRLQGSKGSDSSLGLFMNGLPILLDLKGDVSTYITHTDERLQKLLSHEQTPLSKIHQWSGIPNDLPLFSALLNYRHAIKSTLPGASNPNVGENAGTGMEGSAGILAVRQRTNYPFNLDIDDYGNDFGITARLADVGINPEDVLSYMEEALKALMRHVGSVTSINELSVLSTEASHQLIHQCNDTAQDYPVEHTIIDLFEAQVEKTPEAIAAIYEGDVFSYQELNERSNQLAHYLGSQGIGSNVLVGIGVERSLEMLVGILGVLKSGGAYVPIDPDYPKNRIDYMLKNSGVKLVLSSENCKNDFLGSDKPDVVLLDSDWPQKIGVKSGKNQQRTAGPDDLAYIIYTSGSTGEPKGVMNTHKGIFNQLLWTQKTYELLPSEDVVLHKAAFSFDVAIWELLWPLISGSKLVLARSGGQSDVNYLKELIEAEQVTTIHFVPSMLDAFLTGLSAGDCSSLRRVLCSGEPLTLAQVRSCRNIFPKIRFDNLYGPTEAAVHVSSWSVPENVNSLTTIPIGKPVTNTGLYVLDANEDLVPTGVTGELCIGGPQVSSGYLNNDLLSKERFVKNPFRSNDQLYKTGDLVRMLSDGQIEFIGREDHQVKVRGYRIELGEIAHSLSALSGVQQSVVLARDDINGNNRLIGYVVLDHDLDRKTLQSKMAEHLPSYMIPQLWVQLDQMPLTANGKLDRKALPEPDSALLSGGDYIAPTSVSERQLAEIWQELLGVEKVGIHDNFFELGGHSLLLVKLVAAVNERLKTAVKFDAIFKYPTVAEFTAHLTISEENQSKQLNEFANEEEEMSV